jgi:hypothetical protein
MLYLEEPFSVFATKVYRDLGANPFVSFLARKGLIGQTDNDIGGEICGGEVNIIYYIYVGLAKVTQIPVALVGG